MVDISSDMWLSCEHEKKRLRSEMSILTKKQQPFIQHAKRKMATEGLDVLEVGGVVFTLKKKLKQNINEKTISQIVNPSMMEKIMEQTKVQKDCFTCKEVKSEKNTEKKNIK